MNIDERGIEILSKGYIPGPQGAGGQIFYSSDGSAVIKLSHDPGSKVFFDFVAQASGNPHFPVMNNILSGSQWASAEIERLEELTDANIVLQKSIAENFIKNKGLLDASQFPSKLFEAIDKIKAHAVKEKCFLDITKSDNWMQRSDGTIVISDPFT